MTIEVDPRGAGSPVLLKATVPLVVADGEGILAADDPGEFARHVVGLLQDSTRRAEMARRARAAAEANYHWEAQLARLDQVIAAAVSQPLPRMAYAD